MTYTVGDLIGDCLLAVGVNHGYGALIPMVASHPVADGEAAVMMAAAHARLTGGIGVAFTASDSMLFLVDPWSPTKLTLDVHEAAAIPDAIGLGVRRACSVTPGAVEVRIGADPLEPAPPGVGPVAPRVPSAAIDIDADVLATVTAARRPVVLAGPGVVRAGAAAVAGLRALAASASVGVLNTWGAKGLFDWHSPHHLATAGLQARDFVLAGVAEADLIVATGVDPYEAHPELWQLAPYVEVEPAALASLAESWRRPPEPIGTVPLRARLAEAVAEWTRSDAAPIAPARAVTDAAAVLGPDGFVAADPGTAGLWVARTFATTELGSVAVPARAGTGGWAAACAYVSRLLDPGRRALAVVAEIDPVTAAILDEARRGRVGPVVEVWDPDAAPVPPAVRAAALDRAITSEATTDVIRTCIDLSHTDALVDIAGPVVAWT